MIKIYITEDGTLAFDGDILATVDEYEQADRCVGSVFEALQEGEVIELSIGCGKTRWYELDEDLDIIKPIENDKDWRQRAYLFLLKKRIKFLGWFWGNINRLNKRFFYKPSGYKSPGWEGMDSEEDETLAIEQYKALKKK